MAQGADRQAATFSLLIGPPVPRPTSLSFPEECPISRPLLGALRPALRGEARSHSRGALRNHDLFPSRTNQVSACRRRRPRLKPCRASARRLAPVSSVQRPSHQVHPFLSLFDIRLALWALTLSTIVPATRCIDAPTLSPFALPFRVRILAPVADPPFPECIVVNRRKPPVSPSLLDLPPPNLFPPWCTTASCRQLRGHVDRAVERGAAEWCGSIFSTLQARPVFASLPIGD